MMYDIHGYIFFQVFFRNEASGEFVVYLVNFKGIAAGTIDTIALTTSVRKAISHNIKIQNPLSNQVNFNSECKINGISVPSSFTVAPNGEGSCTFEYLPLKAGSISGRLIFTSSDLGTYQYDLNLNALPPAPEQTVHFNASLGSTQESVHYFGECSFFRIFRICIFFGLFQKTFQIHAPRNLQFLLKRVFFLICKKKHIRKSFLGKLYTVSPVISTTELEIDGSTKIHQFFKAQNGVYCKNGFNGMEFGTDVGSCPRSIRGYRSDI